MGLRLRTWRFLASVVLTLSLARSAAADDEKIVLWLRGGAGDEPAMERALRLELNAKDMTLLSSPSLAARGGVCGSAITAARTLGQTAVDAVMWLEPDPARRILWLRVLRKASDQVDQAPLPITRQPLDPNLFAIVASSLLEQVLRAVPAEQTPPASDKAAAEPVVGVIQRARVGAVWHLSKLF
jgi:hypothetical protein